MGSRRIGGVAALLFSLWAGGSALVAQSATTGPKLSARDQVKVTIWGGGIQVADLSRQYTVDADGMLDLLWEGVRVKVAGLTVREAESELSTRLKTSLVNPQVSIDFQEIPNKKVTVIGSVLNPGQVLFAGEYKILDALTKAGGRKPEASDEALLVRNGEQTTVNLRQLETGNLAGNLVLMDGDQLIVRKAQLVYIGGQVRAPGAYNVDTGTKLRQALTLAGGLTERGSPRGIEILRPMPGKDKDQPVKDVTMETEIKPGDTINVKMRSF